jgi:hypothetical protein
MADLINRERARGDGAGGGETFRTPEASDDEEAEEEEADEAGEVLWDFDGAEALMETAHMVEGAKELHAMLRSAKTIQELPPDRVPNAGPTEQSEVWREMSSEHNAHSVLQVRVSSTCFFLDCCDAPSSCVTS